MNLKTLKAGFCACCLLVMVGVAGAQDQPRPPRPALVEASTTSTEEWSGTVTAVDSGAKTYTVTARSRTGQESVLVFPIVGSEPKVGQRVVIRVKCHLRPFKCEIVIEV